MSKIISMIVFATFVIMAHAANAEYVFDNAGVLRDASALELELSDLANKDRVIIIAETENLDEEKGYVINERFKKYGLDKKGRPEFNMVLVLDPKNSNLHYRVSKGCELREEELTAALNKPNISTAYSEGDYDKALLEAVRNLKSLIQKKMSEIICEIRRPICLLNDEEIQVEKLPFQYKYRGKIKPAAIVLHHIDFPTLGEAVRSLEDQDLSVQLIIDKDGKTYQLMENLDEMSAGAKCANSDSISVEILGDEKSLLENNVQYKSVVKTVKWLAKKYSIDLSKQEAKRPQSGLLAHSEVAALCPNAPHKADPGRQYMQMVRTDACNRGQSVAESANFVIDLTQKLSQEDISKIEYPVLNDPRWRNNAPNIFLIYRENFADELSNEAIDYAELSEPDCIIVANKADSGLQFSSLDCTLSDSEFQTLIDSDRGKIDKSVQEGKFSDALSVVVSDTAESIYALQKMNEEKKKSTEKDLITSINQFFNEIGSQIQGFIIPVSTDPYKQLSDKVMQRAIQYKLGNSNTHTLFEGAKREFSLTPESIFNADSLEPRLLNWHTVLNPEIGTSINSRMFYYPSEPPEDNPFIENLKTSSFKIPIPNGLFCRVEIVNFRGFGLKEKLSGFVGENRIVKCGSEYEIKVGENGDCYTNSPGSCGIKVREGIIRTNYKEYIFSIYYQTEKEIAGMERNKEIARNFIKSIYNGVDSANKNKFGTKITPEELYTISVGEGMVFYLINSYNNHTATAVSGCEHLGIDTIKSQLNYLKENNFIKNDFSLRPEKCKHDKTGELRNSSTFSNMKDALEAAGAVVALAKTQSLQDAQNLGVDIKTLTRKQVNFWTYYYFNCGKECGFSFLRKYVSNGQLRDDSFINAKPGEIVFNGQNARYNAIIRAVMMEFIYDTGIFSNDISQTFVA